MQLPQRLTTAIETVTAAVERLEAAAASHAHGGIEQADLRQEIASLRARRVDEDQARQADAARMEALMSASRQVGARLDGIAASLRALREGGGKAPPPDEPG